MKSQEDHPGDALDFALDLLAEEEQERIGKLSSEALRAEMKAKGIEPGRAHVLLDRVLAELPQAHAPPPPTVLPLAPMRGRRRSLAVGLALAAAAAVLLAAGAMERKTIEAWLAPAPTAPPPVPTVAPPVAPAPDVLAATIRDRAFLHCAQNYWEVCNEELDLAKRIDPSGEDDPRVSKARAAIAEGTSPSHFEGAKPQLQRH